jgi:tetratricopeptide (TPR) repeat protein
MFLSPSPHTTTQRSDPPQIIRAGLPLAILILALSASQAAAQLSLADSAKRLTALAESAIREATSEGFHRAIELQLRAELVYRRLGDPANQSQALTVLGWAYDRIGKVDSALACHQRALAIRKALSDRVGEGESLSYIGSTYLRLGKVDSGVSFLRDALVLQHEVKNGQGEGQTLGALGFAYRLLGKSDSALVYYGRALTLAIEFEDRESQATTLNNIGRVYQLRGQTDSALSYFRESLPSYHSTGDRQGEGVVLNNVGLTYREIGQSDSAVFYLQKALAIRRETGDRRGEGITLNNLALTFDDAKQSDSALTYYRLALAADRQVRNRTGEAIVLNNVGLLYEVRKRSDSALVFLNQALALQRELRDRGGEATTLSNIALVYRTSANLDSAEAYSRLALSIQRDIGDRMGEGTSLANFASYLATQAGNLEGALAYFDSAAAVFDAVMRTTGSESNHLSWADRTFWTMPAWATTWLRRSEELGPEQAAIGALAVAERGRARALLDLMRDTLTVFNPGTDFIAEGKRLASSVARTGSAAILYMITKDTLLTWVLLPDTTVESLRTPISYDSLSARIGALRQMIAVDDQVLFARGGASLEVAADRGGRVEAARGAWVSPAADLAAVLLPPAVIEHLAAAREVVVIPHWSLGLVPFAALPVGPAAEPFGERHAIRYAPSLATLAEAEVRPGLGTGSARRRRLGAALIVGNPAMPEVATASGDRGTLAPLPGAAAESRTVAARLGALWLTGRAASETEIRRRLPSASVVHLATHGFAYSTDAKARASFVALAPDKVNDGSLTVGELLDDRSLHLSAELVVLSACQTGLGDLREAEGTVGLQRAFLARGARSVLVSLWNVSDEATRRLMDAFYRHWLVDPDHPDKAEALRRAQRDVRTTPGFEHPKYWAGFQLVGAR